MRRARSLKLTYILAISILFIVVYYFSGMTSTKLDHGKGTSPEYIAKNKSSKIEPLSGELDPQVGDAGISESDEQNDISILAQLISIVPHENKAFSDTELVHDISKDTRLPLADISQLSADDSFSLYKSLLECEAYSSMSWGEMRDFKTDTLSSLPAEIGHEVERQIKACESIDKNDYQRTYGLLLHAAKLGSPNARLAYASTRRVWVDDKYKLIQDLETSSIKEDIELEEEIFSNKILFLESLQKDNYHMSSLELGELYAGRGKHQDRIKALMSYLIFFAEMPSENNSEKFISNFISDSMRPVDIQLAINGANSYLANKYQH